MPAKPEYGLNDLNHLMERVDQPQRDDLKKLIQLYVEHGKLEEIGAACFYHGSEIGGFVDHTVRVTKLLLEIRGTLAPDVSESDCVLAGVLHDISKGGLPIKEGGEYRIISRYELNPTFNPAREKGPYNKPFNYAKGQLDFQLATSAALIAGRFIPGIGLNVLQAICASDGPTVSRSYYHKECPLALLLEYADRWAMFLETQDQRPSFDGVKFA